MTYRFPQRLPSSRSCISGCRSSSVCLRARARKKTYRDCEARLRNSRAPLPEASSFLSVGYVIGVYISTDRASGTEAVHTATALRHSRTCFQTCLSFRPCLPTSYSERTAFPITRTKVDQNEQAVYDIYQDARAGLPGEI